MNLPRFDVVQPIPFAVGLDLGQASDPSAVAVVEYSRFSVGIDGATFQPILAELYQLRFLERLPLGMSYPAIAARAREVCERLPAGSARPDLVVDGTGVGRAVVDMLRAPRAAYQLVPLTITSGSDVTVKKGGWWGVPKKDLVNALRALFESHLLRLPDSPNVAQLVNELTNFDSEITRAGNVTYGNNATSKHDDLVLAVACACWWLRRQATRGSMAGQRRVL